MNDVEGVEKFLLGAVFAGDKLDIVKKEDGGRTVFFLKPVGGFIPDGVYDFIGEFFAGAVNDARGGVFFKNVLADGLHEVGFSETDPAIEEEGVIRRAGVFGDSRGCGPGHLISGGDGEVVKGEFRAEVGATEEIKKGVFGGGWGGKQSVGGGGLGLGGCLTTRVTEVFLPVAISKAWFKRD